MHALPAGLLAAQLSVGLAILLQLNTYRYEQCEYTSQWGSRLLKLPNPHWFQVRWAFFHHRSTHRWEACSSYHT